MEHVCDGGISDVSDVAAGPLTITRIRSMISVSTLGIRWDTESVDLNGLVR